MKDRIIDHKKMGEVIAFSEHDWIVLPYGNQFEIYQNGERSRFAKTLEEAMEILKELTETII